MEFKQAIVVRTDLKMGKGKTAAQCAHASIEAMEKTKIKFPDWVEEWKLSGTQKVVLKVSSEKELLELFEQVKKEIPTALIRDAGRTQIESGTKTCIGIGPAPENLVDKYTKELKLL
ncbi:peptidyl-tRNA hydrolase Pth2 [Candidatus Micrarchaeota archaeon]|nr:peptidyl-tRNA hydrolase Pth2 [Candidatus Micrarchaeota archaeon]MBU2476625.1 peptidyl-tRNA hydrolase Pth2 [Candidatus Micrarchaeota archaeon]